MGRLFGTNGVRGVVNRELTAEMILRLASTASSLLGKNIALGRDGRTSGLMFEEAAISGLLSAGCTVYNMGILPTPALQFSVKHYGLDGGLMLTASHNPPEFNGLKVIARDGVEVPRELEESIEALYFRGGPTLCRWDEVGRVQSVNPIEDYETAMLKHVDVELIRRSRFRVAIDPGNGVSALTAPSVARKLGCAVISINAELDGRFPGRGSEPRPDNLEGLRALVEASSADLGVAFDGDGDRAIFVDERGEVHWGDRSFALVARDFVARNPGEAVATPVSSSRAVEDVVKGGGGRIIYTRVGSVVVSRTMVESGIKLGGEENGGMFYSPHLPVRDGTMAMALILDIMAREGKPLSQLFWGLPRYHQMKERIPCPNHLKEMVMGSIRGVVKASRIETIDGLKLWYDDGSWILIRPSGTEPILRLYAEAGDPGRVSSLIERHKRLVTEAVESLE
ncbi:MAG: phosphoglucosamine mutase [Candidatus Bathyarchaeia archaeon]